MDPLAKQEELVKKAQGENYVGKRQAMVAARLQARGLKGRAYYDSADHSMAQQKKQQGGGPHPPGATGGPPATGNPVAGALGAAHGPTGNVAAPDAGPGTGVASVVKKASQEKLNKFASESGTLGARKMSAEKGPTSSGSSAAPGSGAVSAAPSRPDAIGSPVSAPASPEPSQIASRIGQGVSAPNAPGQPQATSTSGTSSAPSASSGLRSTGIRIKANPDGVVKPRSLGVSSQDVPVTRLSAGAGGIGARGEPVSADGNGTSSTTGVAQGGSGFPVRKIGQTSGIRSVNLGARMQNMNTMPKAYDLNREQVVPRATRNMSPLVAAKPQVSHDADEEDDVDEMEVQE
ncbi:hypothetical protein FVE85_6319 [Porphyridium purpureum]|uniref:Uncharacterized protein n=1 Tax=Porphyridium purpureum TaxID=35688 RepID=A0A5J4Z6S5_PORPP|nr:hypothetical protein FVE85_6319 [Porphyridium purpureum]|eukprot:POR4975..scf295_1